MEQNLCRRNPIFVALHELNGTPTAAGAAADSSSLSFSLLLFLRLSPNGGSGWEPSHRRRQNPPPTQVFQLVGLQPPPAKSTVAAGVQLAGLQPPPALLPRMASGERSEAPTAAGDRSSRIQQLIFFLVLLFLRLSPSSAAARALLPRMASGERSEAPTEAGATAELNFKVLSIVNNKFVDELAFVVFVF